jgi:multidrug transporter EmrE-like cation transporter
MSYWIALLLAVGANVGANIAFKAFTQKTPLKPEWPVLLAAAFQPSLWIGLCLGVGLLGAYLYALRGLPISVAYTSATTLSIVGITCAGVLIYGEPFSLKMAAGILTVLLGVFLITTA